jgi:hypothetical protein
MAEFQKVRAVNPACLLLQKKDLEKARDKDLMTSQVCETLA